MAIRLSDLLEDLYGVHSTQYTNRVVDAVGVDVVKILNNNPNRLSITIFNLSANALYISPSTAVSATNGIYIAPNGGSVTLMWDRDFELVGQAWYGIALGAASSVFILENISI